MKTKKATGSIFSAFCLVMIAVTYSGCVRESAKGSSPDPVIATASESDPLVRSARAMIDKMPDSPAGYTKLAAVYIRKARETGDFGLNRSAEASVARALEISAGDAGARKLQASLHLTFHRFAEALEAGKNLQRDFPNDSFVYGVLTDANAELGNYEEAVDNAQKMVDLRPGTSSYARVAHLRSLHGDNPGAVEMFRLSARTADPTDKEAQSWCLVQLGDEHWKNGKFQDAENTYDEALQIFPNYHLALAGKGRALAARGDLNAAAALLSDANDRVPNVEATILLGDVYAKLGNAERAQRQYDLVQVIEQKLGVSNDQKRLAILWADRDTNLDEALSIARREHDNRKDILAADALAWTLYKKGLIPDAKVAAAEALRLDSNDAKILYHAGMIEKSLGNRNQAKRLLEKALKTNPAFDLLQADNARNALAELG